ncbi:sulfatase [Parapedobacter sp. 10938]|uniref:sulfatase n=1 Tax=Parapedobacter flavus TaxID=3110225 RepID=UPI002DB8ED9C|nr:sulfatase [Parapedobacter sp. 10938]MEC3878990.1 sulfatase [Parapedobacter sp. 10938]
MYRFFILSFCLLQCLIAGGKESDRPNVLFILVDDLGWADLACYGNPVHETPHIDRLAASGMTFTNAYASAPICSASRASLLTGKSPARLGFEFVSKPDGSNTPKGTLLSQPSYPRDLPLSEKTIAEQLNLAYSTGYFGKWHLTQENDAYLGWGTTLGPLQQGFHTGSEHRGSHSYGYSPTEKGTFADSKAGTFPADSLTELAVRFLEEHRTEPFMLFYSMYYVHTPVKTRNKWLYDKYREKLGPDADEALINYAAFIETMDHYIGQLLRTLEELGIDENTIIIFTSDNGGDPRFSESDLLRSGKWTLYEGGIRVPAIVRWNGRVKSGSVSDVPINGYDWYPTIAELTGHSAITNDGIDGQSIVSVLRGGQWAAGGNSRPLYWHFPFYHQPVVDSKPQSAIRVGKYKMIYFYEEDRTELYNLDSDRAETHDIARSLPEQAAKMKDELFSILDSVGARVPSRTY